VSRPAGADGRPGPSVERRPIPFHPLLLAAFPVLFLFAENAVQQVTLDPLWTPLAAAVGAAVALTLVASALVRDWLRGAFVASVLVALFFSFGHAWNLLRDTLADRSSLALIYAAIALAAILVASRGGRWVVPTTRALNVAAVVVVGINLFRIGQFALGTPTVALAAPETSAIATPASAIERKPDIFYVILDRYSNAETLERLYGFDNRPFLDELERRGFVIAEDSWANYLKTGLSLLSSLNMEYLDGEALGAVGGDPMAAAYAAFRNHLAVPVALKQLGYEYVHIGSAWEPTAKNVDADRVVRWREGSEFAAAVLGTSVWGLSQPDIPPGEEDEEAPPTDRFTYLDHLRQDTLFQFDRLEDAADRPGPTFVFAHVLMPHNPWRFNADGSLPTEEQLATRSRDESFLEHVKWTNQRVLEMLDVVLDAPPGEEPIVIVQADEGEFPIAYARNQTDFDWLHASPDEVQHKYGILNAFHLPGVDAAEAGVHDRISPVNAFRVVFNAYFEADLPLLPDRTYLSPTYARLYDFVEYRRP
jgi:hypothetical protein